MRHLLPKKSYVRRASLASIAAVFAVALTPLPHTASAAGSTVGELKAGESLNRGETVTSQNGQYKLKLQSDGNLVHYNGTNKAIWALGTIDPTASKFSVQADGNLVLYNQAGKTVWQSFSLDNTGTKKLVVQNDGSLIQYATTPDDVTVLWHEDLPNRLYLGAELTRSDVMISKTGQYRMRVQQDGNMVIYTQAGKPVWAAKPYNSKAFALAWDRNGGQAYLATTSGASWNSKNYGTPLVEYITLQDDGNLVIYNEKGQGVWHR